MNSRIEMEKEEKKRVNKMGTMRNERDRMILRDQAQFFHFLS